MPILSSYARSKKLEFFMPHLPEDARILEVGSGDGWLGEHLRAEGWNGYRSIDLVGPADFVGDINTWPEIGIESQSFDVIIAFEVVEHGDFYEAFAGILRPGGLLFLTTPCPQTDWFLKLLEKAGLNQKRTSPHSHLHELRNLPGFEPVLTRKVAGLAQWGIFRRKPEASPVDAQEEAR